MKMPFRRRTMLTFVALATLHGLASFGSAESTVARIPSTQPSSLIVANAEKTSLFDSSRHMRVGEVRAGMKGFGLSVFKGTKLEKFDVEVVSVLHNFNPKKDVVLIMCSGQNLEHSGSIQGMSGSPIFLVDDAGRERMIGAFAYGFPLCKDPLAGVQPIEYMLEMPDNRDGDTSRPGPAQARLSTKLPPRRDGAEPNARWTPQFNFKLPKPNEVAAPDSARLQPLATPLMVSGLSDKTLRKFEPLFRSYGLSMLQSGGGGASGRANSSDAGATTRPACNVPSTIEPGSVLAVPILVGDVNLIATGTCTERIGERVFGFGHPFTSEGPVAMPMAAGEINGIVSLLTQSFKLGGQGATLGTIGTDQLCGVAGHFGAPPKMIPIDVNVKYADGSEDEHWVFEAARHPRFTAAVAGVALASALTGNRDLPQYYTVDYKLSMTFDGGRELNVANRGSNTPPAELLGQIIGPIMAAADNPFERVLPEKISASFTVHSTASDANILSVDLPRSKFRPGETLKAYLKYRPFRGQELVLPLEMELPRDLADGTYQLVVSDWERYFSDEATAKPFKFSADNIDEVFDVFRDVLSIRRDALYLRLVQESDGVAIGRTAMARLPSSVRKVMLGAGRSNTTEFVSSTVKVLPTELVMSGAAEFQITIDSETKVEIGGANKPASETPKAEEPSKKHADVEKKN